MSVLLIGFTIASSGFGAVRAVPPRYTPESASLTAPSLSNSIGDYGDLMWHTKDGYIVEAKTPVTTRMGIMALVFCVSLFAASFPIVSNKMGSSKPPRMLFFIGKHFGSGVILATAFVHLLQDAFECLLDPRVREIANVGQWTGLIVMSSLLIIFLVEFLSTSYVDRLQSYSSAPPSPKIEPAADAVEPMAVVGSSTQVVLAPPSPRPSLPPTEITPLLHSDTSVPSRPITPPGEQPVLSPASAPPHPQASHKSAHAKASTSQLGNLFSGHHRHEPRTVHAEHHGQLPRGSAVLLTGEDAEAALQGLNNKNKKLNHERSVERDRHLHGSGHTDLETLAGSEVSEEEEIAIGRKRQIVGILVLQLGIMIHSVVIGLTLSVASGSDFTSLVAAISFHQLFEGLSLGIRIAGLPARNPDTPQHVPFPRAILVFLFAITTPAGIVIGLLTFGAGRSTSGTAQMILVEGLLCAVSGGMLVYAACVEMLASDFVLDPSLWRSGVAKQVLALASLLTGAAAMSLIGM